MGLILPQNTIIKWTSSTKNHYVNLGYEFTKYGEQFNVHVLDLTDGCQSEVLIYCDYCKQYLKIPWRYYKALKGNTYCCPDCLKHKKKTRDENGELIFVEVPYSNKE